MDSLTQVALGATVAEVAVGKKAGNKAILWGSVFGMLPDLDVLIGPLVDEVTMLGVHRGFSHSVIFFMLLSPLMGKMLAKIHKNIEVSWIMWTWTVFLSLFTHALLDTFTVYGTQLLKPVTDHPFGINSIFIVDLVYTVPMVAGIIISLFLKKGVRRHRLNVITLAISTIYLLMSLGMKLYTLEVFKDNLERENIQYEDIITMPTALNIVMFECIARDGDDLYVGLYSVFEDDENIRFRKLERNTELIENDLDSRAIKKLLWFSRGYYKVHRKEDGLHFSDLRFGRSDLWLSDNGEFVFDFKLVKNEKGEVISFKRGSPGMEINKELLKKFFNRVLAKN